MHIFLHQNVTTVKIVVCHLINMTLVGFVDFVFILP